MKKIISILISLLFVISALLPFATVSAASVDEVPDGTVVFKPDFNGMPGIYEPGFLSGSPDAAVDPIDSNTLVFQTTKNKSASYWGGFIETLPLDEYHCYTIYYTVTRTGNHAIGVYADSIYGAYGYPDKSKLMTKGSSLPGHDYLFYTDIGIASPEMIGGTITQEYALEINGVDCTIAQYLKDNVGEYKLVDQSLPGEIEYFNADVLGLFFYTYYTGHIVTVSNCYIVKGLSFGDVVYPESTPAPETTKAPETEAPETEPVATEPEPTDAPEATDAPATDAPATNAPATNAPAASEPAKSGCGGMIAGGAILAIVACAVPVFFRKRR